MPILIVSAAIATPPGIGRNATTERNTTMIPNTVFTFFFMPLPPFFPRECTRPDAEKPTSRFLYYRHIVLCCQEEKRPPRKEESLREAVPTRLLAGPPAEAPAGA